jgi:hypothetical protein
MHFDNTHAEAMVVTRGITDGIGFLLLAVCVCCFHGFALIPHSNYNPIQTPNLKPSARSVKISV